MQKKTDILHVPAKDIERNIYVSEDGKEFTHEKDCIRYEINLKLDKIRTMDTGLYPFINTFYYMDSPETIEFFIKNMLEGHYKTIKGNKIQPGDWVCYNMEYDNDGPNGYDIITLVELQETIKKLKA